MNFKRAYSLNQLRDYSSLFSRGSILEWMSGNLSSIDYKLNRYDQQWLSKDSSRYIDYLKYIYSILENHYQNEYVLKNSFLNDWLIKELGENNSPVFSEFRVGNAIADLVMFNGVSKVFEIKTELDSDKRLNRQLEEYKKIFNEIYLIVPSSKFKLYQSYDVNIGIITFNKDRNDRFCLKRPAINNSAIDPKVLMHIFHTYEYKEIIKNYFNNLPKMSSFNQFKVCSELIENIPNNELNYLFINQMKKRESTDKLSNRYYKEFNQMSLALKLNNKNRKLLFSILKSPLNN